MPTSSARTLKSPRRLAAPGSPDAKPAMAVPARVPQESGDGRLDHPVEPDPDRPKMLAPVDWETTRLFVEYGPGVGTFTRPILDRLGPDATLIAIDTNPDFIDYLQRAIDDPRLIAVPGSAADVEKIVADRGLGHADYVALRPALFDPAAGCRRGDRRGDGARSSAPAARSWSISSAPRCSDFIEPAFRADRSRLRMDQRAPGDPVLGVWREPAPSRPQAPLAPKLSRRVTRIIERSSPAKKRSAPI